MWRKEARENKVRSIPDDNKRIIRQNLITARLHLSFNRVSFAFKACGVCTFEFVQARFHISLLLLLGLLLGSCFAPLPGTTGYSTGAGAYGGTLACITCNGANSNTGHCAPGCPLDALPLGA